MKFLKITLIETTHRDLYAFLFYVYKAHATLVRMGRIERPIPKEETSGKYCGFSSVRDSLDTINVSHPPDKDRIWILDANVSILRRISLINHLEEPERVANKCCGKSAGANSLPHGVLTPGI